MGFGYEQKDEKRYLVYTIEDDDVPDSVNIGMITNNDIPGLAHACASLTDDDEVASVKYDITSYVSAKEVFSGLTTRRLLVGMFSAVTHAMLSADDYLLAKNGILLDPEYIFVNKSTGESLLICLPVISREEQTDLPLFMKSIVFGLRFDRTENADYIFNILNYLNGEDEFSLDHFCSILNVLSDDYIPAARKQRTTPPSKETQKESQEPPIPIAKKESVQKPREENISDKKREDIREEKQTSDKKSFFSILQQYTKDSAEDFKSKKSDKNGDDRASSDKYAVKKAQAVDTEVLKRRSTMPDAARTGKQFNAAHSYKPDRADSGKAGAKQSSPQRTDSGSGKTLRRDTPAGRFAADTEKQSNVIDYDTAKSKRSSPELKGTADPSTYDNAYAAPVELSADSIAGTSDSGGLGFDLSPDLLDMEPDTDTQESTTGGLRDVPCNGKPYVRREKTGLFYSVDKPMFIIGSDKSAADCFVGGNKAISHQHAGIINKDGEYYVVDFGSTNHTYVNGKPVLPNKEFHLEHGVKVRLGNEVFTFKLF